MPYVEENGFGCFEGSPEGIGEKVEEWFATPSKLDLMRENALEAARPDATLDIARDLADMVIGRRQELNATGKSARMPDKKVLNVRYGMGPAELQG